VLFNSLEFLCFMLLVVSVYWVLPRVAQNVFLVVASYFFYGWWSWKFLLLLAFSTLLDFTVGILLARATTAARKRLILLTSIGANLGLLGFFKYFNFFADSLHALLLTLGIPSSLPTLNVILPVGISFYTFVSMSYAIDVYRGQFAPVRSLLNYAAFVSFFPLLVAGPIERAGHLIPQFAQTRRFRTRQFFDGLYLILYGLAKKVVVADNVARFVDVIFALDHPTTALIVVGTFGFGVQIYADFSGYSDIARGAAKLLGFDLMHNFNLPYFARSPAEFWTRWHISLSRWIRDYVYIPLGGSRCTPRRRDVNLITAFTLSGLWHGASMNFVLWGLYHALFLIGYRLVFERSGFLQRAPRWLASPVLWLVTQVLVFYGWLLFRVRDFGYLRHLHGIALDVRHALDGIPDALAVLSQMAIYVLPLALAETAQWGRKDTELVLKRHWSWQMATCTALVLVCVVFGVEDNAAFIYFQF
jgi:D-alanyl-lipoteichoic acid acyltransferase DltB (MBOAT superfamily)